MIICEVYSPENDNFTIWCCVLHFVCVYIRYVFTTGNPTGILYIYIICVNLTLTAFYIIFFIMKLSSHTINAY